MPRAALLKRWTALLLLMLALPACSTLTGESPPATDSTLVEVLVDLNLAKARAQIGELPQLPPGLRDSIFARHGLDSASFEAAMAPYARHPKAYADLYGAVLDRLDAERYGRGERGASPASN